jgi:dihydroorotate dehydrogenase electron transfer subunit
MTSEVLRMDRDKYTPLRIERIRDVDDDVRVFKFLKKPGKATKVKPGEYIMLWIPGVSENPFSVMDDDLSLMVKRVGEEGSFTSEMFNMDEGDEVFARGTFGNSFNNFLDPKARKYVVAGGVGIAPLCSLDHKSLGKSWSLYYGAANERLAREVVSRWGTERVSIATEDGSYGSRGVVTDLFMAMEIDKNSQFLVCGPEAMMEAVVDLAANHVNPKRIILSVERYMKCGAGMCGNCEIEGAEGASYTTCDDGPVFTYDMLEDGGLGVYRRSRSGKRVPIGDPDV